MRSRSRAHKIGTASAIVLMLGAPRARGQVTGGKQPAPETLACRVIESKTAAGPRVRLVIFHQGDSSDRETLGTFLKAHDGGSIQFQTSRGSWQPATVFRLKTCFGRGLLVFSNDQADLAEGDRFLLRVTPAAEQ